MKSMLKLLVAPLALCAGQAVAGNDFCDESTGPDWTGVTAPNGGSCEVEIFRGSEAYMPPPLVDRGPYLVHDLSFDEGLYLRLQSGNSQQNPYRLNFKVAISSLTFGDGRDAEMGIAEWLFSPPDKSAPERLLSLSLAREGDKILLLADWLMPPRPTWSSVGGSKLEPLLLEHDRMTIGYVDESAVRLSWSELEFARNGNVVSVLPKGADAPAQRPIQFKLPTAQWTPTRLRNGVLHATGLGPEDGVHLSWPGEFKECGGEGEGSGGSIGGPALPDS
ncbi:hypothetical protein [Lysobacter sp. CA199]|uniref:hypothetical protein n=1 Tax=Lysobacter sp. CA199 TaxID=3455608 RepID=UPI003F8D34AF